MDDPSRRPEPDTPPGRGGRHRAPRLCAALVTALALGLGAARPAAAQERLFPGESLMPTLDAAPLSPQPRGSFLLADRPRSDFPGANLEAEVTLGHALPVLLVQPEGEGRPALGLEFRVGVFSRFFMETAQRDLIAADYRVDVPFTFRSGPWEGRVGYQHFSAHVADDFIARFAPPLRQHSRDGLEAVVARRMPSAGVRIYLGGRYNFHANPGVHERASKAGVEWDPGQSNGEAGGVWPFAAVDFEARDGWDGPAGTGTAGLRLRARGQDVRLEVRGHFGPTSMGQLLGTEERFVGLGLRIDF